MKYKKGLIFIFLIICLFSIASVCASDVNETVVASEDQIDEILTVEDNNDIVTYDDQVKEENVSVDSSIDEVSETEENELSASLGTFNDLANDIENAGEELNLTRDYIYNNESDSSYIEGINISKTLTIQGNGHTIDALKKSRIFKITASNIVLRNLTIKNGFASNGGAIYVSSDSHNNVFDCYFVNNSADWGGAIYLSGDSSYNRFDCCFKNNSASSFGGAIYFKTISNHDLFEGIFDSNVAGYGGAISFGDGLNYDIFNGSFINNSAKSYGGVIYLGEHDEFVKNEFDGNFINNSAGTGGAIYLESTRFGSSKFNGNFINNHASNNGGAVYLYALVYSNEFNGNFINNSATNRGGGLYITTSSGNYFGGVFNRNTAKIGGAVYCNKINSNNQFNGAIFTNNSAETGSALYFYEIINQIDIINSIFVNNGRGAIIHSNKGTKCNIDYCWFGNTVDNYNIAPNVNENVNINRWLFLNATASPIKIFSKQNSTIIFSLSNLYDDSSKEIKQMDVELPEINLNIFYKNGIVDKDLAVLGEHIDFTLISDSEGNVIGYYNGIAHSIIIKSLDNVSLIAPDISCDHGNLKRFNITLTENKIPLINETIKIKINNQSYIISTDDNGQISIDLDLDVGNYTIISKYYGLTVYSNYMVNKADSSVVVNQVNGTVAHNLTLTAVVSSSNNLTIKEGTVTFMDGNNVIGTVNVNDNIATLVYAPFINGEHIITAIYDADNYLSSNGTAKVFVDSAKVSFSVNPGKVGIDSTFIVNIKGLYSTVNEGTVSFYIGDKLIGKSNVVNGSANLVYAPLVAGNFTVKAVFGESANFIDDENTTSFTVNRADSIINVIVKNNITYGENATVILTTNVDGKAKIKLGAFNTSVDVTDKYATVIIQNLNANDNLYDVDVEFIVNDDNYNNSTGSSVLKVSKAKPVFAIDVNDSQYKKDISLTIRFADDITGYGNITVSNDNGFVLKFSNLAINNGILCQELSNLNASKYNITFEYSGNNNYNSTTVSETFNVFKIDPIINIEVINATYGAMARIIVNSDAEGNATITIGSIKTYENISIDNNKIIQDVSDIDVGTYPVKVTYNGNNNYNIKTFDAELVISKASTTILATVNDITYSESAVINVKASVDGNVIVQIDESYIDNVNVLANTVTPVIFNSIPAGKHNVSITLKPSNNNYNESAYKTNFTVSKKQTSIELGVANSIYGEDVIINVTASEDGKVVLKVGDITREINVLANTMLKINFGILAADSYNVEATFNAGENYKPSTKNDNIIISPAKAEILILQAENNIYGDNTIIKVKTNVEGTLTFKVGNITKTFDIVSNELISFDFGILDAKTYDVEVSLDAGNNYTKSINTTQVTIESKQTTVDVNVKNSTYGEDVIVNVTASENGEISVNIGDITKYVNVEANKSYSVDFSVLNADSYNVYVSFDGGNNFKKSYNNVFLIVFPAKSQITEIQAPNNFYGENTIIRVKTNEGGVLTAKINTITKEVNLNANQLTSIDFGILDANNYELELSFNAGNNYVPTTATKTFKVLKTDPTISVAVTNATYGQAATIIVNSNAEGNATIEIGSVKTYNNVLFKNNVIIQDITDIDSGTYPVKITYNGNNNYNVKTYDAKLTINKASSTTVATVDDITYSENAIINVKGSVDGIAIVKIDESYIKNINVIANTIVPAAFENIPVGKHNVTITLKPSSKNYEESIYNTDFTVSQKETTVNLNVVDSDYGEDVIINVTASEDGKVVLKVGDITREKNVMANIQTIINLGILSAKSYDADVSFNAGENYKLSTQQKSFTVSPAKAEITVIQVQNNTYGENTIINVKTSVAGVLTVKLNNANTQTFNIDANKLTALDLGKYDVDNYNIDLTLDAGSNYTQATGNAKVTVNPKKTTVELNVNNNVYGENVIVNVTASENGKVTVKVGTNTRTVDVEANKVSSVDFGILDAKSYEVDATFDGGKNYQTSSDKDSLVISSKETSVTFVDFINSYVYTQNVVIKVKTDTDGTLTVKVGDTPQTKQVIAGNVVTFDFGILNVNNYGVTINLTAGNNYVPYQNTASFAITPKTTSIVVNAKDYDTTEKVIVNVTTTENGKVSIKLGDITKTIDVNSNTLSSIDFGLLDVGSYKIVANFTAGNNYINSTDTGNVKVVSKIKEDDVNISIPDIIANQENQIVINLPSDATGTVTLIIGNNTYPFTVNNGVATVKVPKLEDGTYEYIIKYSGDNNYSSFSTSGNIDVSKPTPDVEIPPLDKPSSDGSVTINLPQGATGTVTLVIDKKPYSFPVQNGVAKIYMPELANGNYPYTITYSGDGKYASFTKTGTVTVNKQTTPTKPIAKITITLKSVKVKKSAKKLVLQATLKQGNTPLKSKKITFKFNGKKYIAKTNKKGIAKVTIKKSVLKKLKVGKKVKYQASYGKVTAKKTAKVKK